jgi:iron complex transport system ATP-binding protein
MGDDKQNIEIQIQGLSVKYYKETILSNLNLEVAKGSFTGIIGPNGSGKTTLLKCISKELSPVSGRILIARKELSKISTKELAGFMGVVPQKWGANFPFTASEVVMMGRFPHLKRFAKESKHDRMIVREAMTQAKVLALADRPITEMSGGELQRVIIAQALAQSPQILLLDEPTSHLDINHALEICELLKNLVLTKGLTILAVFHDLNLASRYCENLILLKEGRVYVKGTPEEVLTSENLEAVFGVKAIIQQETYTGKPYVFFFPKVEKKDIHLKSLQ